MHEGNEDGREEKTEIAKETERQVSRKGGTVETCQTCKHWDEWKPNPRNLGSCNRLSEGDGGDGQTHISSGLDSDGNLNMAFLNTRADFGCTLHEARHD